MTYVQKRLDHILPSAITTGQRQGPVEKGLRILGHFRSSVLDRFCESYTCFMTYVLQRFGNLIPVREPRENGWVMSREGQGT